MNKRLLLVLTLFVAALAAPASLWTFSSTAGAVFAGADIGDAAGPLTHIYIGQSFSCQVAHTGDAQYEMYDPSDPSGDCSTVVKIDGGTYGNSSFAGNDFTFVSQSAVTGAGTVGDPRTVTTVGDAANTGVRVTETDTYVIGNEFYRTDVQLTNTNDVPITVRIYRGADCYLGGSDEGYGFADPVGKVVACTQNINNSPPGRIEEWTPITPADHYYESTCCSDVENLVDSGSELPDTCDCSTLEDNGAAISWNRTIGAGLSATVSHFTTFSPLGVGAPTPTPGGQTTAVPSASATPTTQVPLKTHTPTRTPTAAATLTPTPAPATNTPAARATNTVVAPTGGREGVIVGPNTGSGPDRGGGVSRSVYFITAALLLAGGGIAATAIRRTKRR